MSEFLDQVRRQGGKTSGQATPADFERGWATHPFTGAFLAHYWTVTAREPERYCVASACGMWTVCTGSVPLLLPGTFDECRNCDRALLAQMKRTRKGL